jgi:hypothetical protein
VGEFRSLPDEATKGNASCFRDGGCFPDGLVLFRLYSSRGYPPRSAHLRFVYRSRPDELSSACPERGPSHEKSANPDGDVLGDVWKAGFGVHENGR